MLAAFIQTAVAVFLLVEGILCVQSHPGAARLLGAVRRCLAPLLGPEYEIPDLTIGIFVLVLAAFAMVNAFMIYAALFGFWVV
ncbi:MAG: hypothetical protein HY303_15175 [Candidatus Wallbacteria bacterium]|nr:hypothetical protein [Candidatus Wallbacteria bacterium]